MDLFEEREKLVDEISLVSQNIKKSIKPLILQLVSNIEKSLNTPQMQNTAKMAGVDEPSKKDIAVIMDYMRKKHGWLFGRTALYEYLSADYKRDYNKTSENYQPERMTDEILLDKYPELQKRYEKLTRGPSKDIVIKEKVDDMEKYDWQCWVAQELARLAIKMEREHKETHEDSLCREYAKRTKMVRDSRFATDMNSYEAIVVAASSTQSLTNAISGEFEHLKRWEVEDNEDKCKECLGHEQCKKEKCKCVCHAVLKPMTTKGYKYAIKTNEDLKKFEEKIKDLVRVDNNLCRIGKTLLENPKTSKFLRPIDKQRLMTNHIERHDCLQCDMFMEKNPKFFEVMK